MMRARSCSCFGFLLALCNSNSAHEISDNGIVQYCGIVGGGEWIEWRASYEELLLAWRVEMAWHA